MHSAQLRFTLPGGQGVHSVQLRFSFPWGAGVALRAIAFQLPVGAGAALHAVAFQLPVRAPFPSHRVSCPTVSRRFQVRLRASIASSQPITAAVSLAWNRPSEHDTRAFVHEEWVKWVLIPRKQPPKLIADHKNSDRDLPLQEGDALRVTTRRGRAP